jgi:hypothetical protein
MLVIAANAYTYTKDGEGRHHDSYRGVNSAALSWSTTVRAASVFSPACA